MVTPGGKRRLCAAMLLQKKNSNRMFRSFFIMNYCFTISTLRLSALPSSVVLVDTGHKDATPSEPRRAGLILPVVTR